MTSFAFILGCVPLWTATGAGSVARQIMGTTVIGGMLAASADRNLLRPGDLLPGGEMVWRRPAAGLPRRTAGNACAGGGRLKCAATRITAANSGVVMHEAGHDCCCRDFGFDSLMTGCMVGPNYHRPVVQTPTVYRDLSAKTRRPRLRQRPLPTFPGGKSSRIRNCKSSSAPRSSKITTLQLATERISRRARSGRHHALQSVSASARERQFHRRKRHQLPNQVQLSGPHRRRSIPVGSLRSPATRDRGRARPAPGHRGCASIPSY